MIRATVLGGVFFLIPLAFVVMALGEAYAIGLRVAEPLSDLIPIDDIGGVALANVLAAILLFLVCLLAGMTARIDFIRRRIDRLDQILIELVPSYAVTKITMRGMTGHEAEATPLKPVLVTYDDHKAFAFEVDRRDDYVVVYVPGAPSVWSGSTAVFTPDRVRRLDLSLGQTAALQRVFGRGAAEAVEVSNPNAGG